MSLTPNDSSNLVALLGSIPGICAAIFMFWKWRTEKRGVSASADKTQADSNKTEAETVNIWQETYNKIIDQLTDRDMKMAEMRQDIETLKLENSRTKTINNHLTEENTKLLDRNTKILAENTQLIEERTSLKLKVLNLQDDVELLRKQVNENTNAIGD